VWSSKRAWVKCRVCGCSARAPVNAGARALAGCKGALQTPKSQRAAGALRSAGPPSMCGPAPAARLGPAAGGKDRQEAHVPRAGAPWQRACVTRCVPPLSACVPRALRC